MSNVNLILENDQAYHGDIIKGKVVCNFRKRKEVRKIRVRLTGEEHTHWIGSETYYDSNAKQTKTRSVNYSGDRTFICSDLIVHGEGTIESGEHIFHFQFTLPEDIPDTFHHNYGRITYSVTVTVDRPFRLDFEDVKIITVRSPIKLQSLSSDLLAPVELSDEKTVCCFCCASGPIQLDVNLEKRAFIVGENANIKIYCLNMSNVNVETFDVSIKMKWTFTATSPRTDYRYDTEYVAKSYLSGVGAHGEKTFNLRLEIPRSTVVPNFTACELFSCSTKLEVSARINGCHSNLDIPINIALGHIPCPEAPSVVTAPLEPLNEIQLSMPMPLPEYEDVANKAIGIPPYPAPAYSPGPSAPQEAGAPSAPPKSMLAEDAAEPGAGDPLLPELPPPTYDEAAKNH